MRPRVLALALLLSATPVLSDAPTPLWMSLKDGRAGIGDLSSISSFDLELPGGESARATLRASAESRQGWDGASVVRWTGYLDGIPDSEVTLTQKEGYTAGTLRIGRDRWYLDPKGTLIKDDPSQALPCGNSEPAALPQDLVEKLKAPEDASLAYPATASYIDVLAVYDSTFLQESGGKIQAEVKIEDAIARASEAVNNSNAGAPYRLVGIVKLSQDISAQTPFSVMLSQEVRTLRDQYGADLVQGYGLTFYNSTGIQVGGMAIYSDNPEVGYPSVVSYYAVHLHTPAHELGHNSAADHEEAAAQRPAPARPFSSFCQSEDSIGWATIMWSGVNRPPGNCRWWEIINYFSNPHMPYNGLPLGVQGEMDNARVMRTTAPQVVAFRPSKITQPTSCTPDSETLCLNGGRFQVRAKWRTHTDAGIAKAVRMTEDTGYLWFFNQTNVEAVVKVLNGCSLNNHYWFFAGGLTDVGVVFTVTDTKTGVTKQYTNAAGERFAPIQDTIAFATCQ